MSDLVALVAALALAATTAPAAPAPSLAGVQLGSSMLAILATLGTPDSVATRDDGIHWQWSRRDGLDREITSREDLTVSSVLVAERENDPEETPSTAEPSEFPVLGLRIADADAVLASAGARIIGSSPASGPIVWQSGDDYVVTLLDAGVVSRILLLDAASAARDGYISGSPPEPHHAVTIAQPAPFSPLPDGHGLAVTLVDVDASGAVVDARMLMSSGDSAIDAWVLANARRTRYAPASCAGRPCAGVYASIDGVLR